MRQAAVADRLVITKTDMVDSDQRASAQERSVAAQSNRANFRRQWRAGFDADSLLSGGVTDPKTKLAEVRHWLAGTDQDHAHHDEEHEAMIPARPRSSG